MQLSLITNNSLFAKEAEECGIERIMIDLERNGKKDRQHGRNLFLSDHTLDDVIRLRESLTTSKLFVRINPPGPQLNQEIDQVINCGVDYLMLPYFHKLEEVKEFIKSCRKKVKTVLLVETRKSVEILPQILEIEEVDEIHIGLNDLSISMNYNNIFEPILNGSIDKICALLNQSGKPYGFGGIGSLSNKSLPVDPEILLAEQIRLGCSRGWLGRTFRGNLESEREANQLKTEVKLLRKAMNKWEHADQDQYSNNFLTLEKSVEKMSFVGKQQGTFVA